MGSMYHNIEKDGLPEKDGRYMVKFHIDGRPGYDNTEICFRDFVDGQFVPSYYTNEKTDILAGWYE